MKKYTLLFVILSSFILAGCESNHEQLYKACQNQDFELAHQILDKMKSENNSYYKDDCLYLFEIESTYLLEQNSDEATQRIELLLNELPYKDSDWGWIFGEKEEVLDRLLQKAAILNNVDLIRFILKNYINESNAKISLKAWNYLGEQIDENILSIFSDKLVDMFDCYGGNIWGLGTKELFEKVFDKCLESGNLELAKKLLDHLDYLQQTKAYNYDSEDAKAFVATLKKKYQSAIKNNRKK